MPSQCLPLLQFDAVRVTRLTNCGEVIDTECAYATSESVVTLSMTNNNQDRQEFLQLNGKGEICVDATVEPQLRWINFELTFCKVDPELFSIVTGEPLVLSDAAVPVAIGWNTTQEGPLNSFFALEGWTLTGDSCDDGVADYGYFLLPFARGAQLSDVTLENGNINFTVTGRTTRNPLWGTGPYNVRIIEAVTDLGEPAPLLTPMLPTQHRRMFWTELPPPAGVCGCQDLTPAVLVAPLPGLAAVPRVMTFPLDPADGSSMLPAYVDWGDASPSVLVTSGTTLNHNYVIGTYTATFRSLKYSSPTYTSATITVT